MHKYPALRIAVLLALGILWGEFLAPSPFFTGGCAAMMLLIALGFRRSKRASPVVSVLLQLAMVFVAASIHTIKLNTESSRRLNPLYKGEEIAVSGRVDSSPTLRDSVMRFTVYADSITRGGKTVSARRRLAVRFESPQASFVRPLFYEGRPVWLNAELDIFPHRRNPGDIDFGKILTLDGVTGVVRVRNISDVRFPDGERFHAPFVAGVRRKIGGAIDVMYSGQSSAFLRGLLLGDRAFIDKDIIEDFSLSGTIHILAVSGAHVGVIASLLFGVLLFVRLPRKWVAVLVIAGLWAFALLTGSQPPVIRAVIMASIILAGVLLQRKPYPLNSLGVAAIVMMIIDTRSLFDPAVHLSFASVSSLLLVYPRVRGTLTLTVGPSKLRRLVNPVLALVSVSCAAVLGVSPFTAYYYGTVSIIAIIANVFIVPLAGFVMSFGIASILFKLFLPFIAVLLARLTSELIHLMMWVARFSSDLPGAVVQIPQPSPELILVFYLLLGLLLVGNLKKILFGVGGLIAVAVAVIGISNVLSSHHTARLTVLDVGRGTSALITGQKERYLINGGSAQYTYDAGIAAIVPFLQRIDCDSLTSIVATSHRSDHIGGIPAVIRHIPAGKLFVPFTMPSNITEWNLVEEAFVVNLPISLLTPDEPLTRGLEFRIYPLAAERVGGKREFGLLVKRGGSSVLFATGMSGESALQIANRYERLFPADILVIDARDFRSRSFVTLIRRASPKKVVLVGTAPRSQPLFDAPNHWRVEKDGAFEFDL